MTPYILVSCHDELFPVTDLFDRQGERTTDRTEAYSCIYTYAGAPHAVEIFPNDLHRLQ